MRLVSSLVVVGGLLCATFAAEAACPGPDCVDLFNKWDRATVDFFASGGSFAEIDDINDDRPGRVLDVAEVAIPQSRIPRRAELLNAYLYFGGSLFLDNDGNDTPDRDVELQVPGTTQFTTVAADEIYQSGAIPNFPEVTLYVARADITDMMKSVGGPLFGTYRVRGFNADILNGSQKHTAANASFSIILVFQEPRLSPRTVVLFDGMQEVLGATTTLNLSDFIVSQVPSGSLTLYAQEGDCHPGPGDCDNGNNLAGAERVRVIGEDPSRAITLSDPTNPSNDLFNRTINTVEPPLKNVPGTDIDTFDITPALRAGDQSANVQITTPNVAGGHAGELIGLAYVIVGIDVFAPELRVDSRIEIRTARGDQDTEFFPGDELRVGYVVSNTGNLPASGVTLTTDMPKNVVGFEVAEKPEGAMVDVEPTGGINGTGRVIARNIGVRHGDANDLVLNVITECPLPQGGDLVITASISAANEGGLPFGLNKSVPLRARTRCGPRFFLFGGGGCQATPTSDASTWVAVIFGLFGLVVLFRKRLAILVAPLLSSLLFLGCVQDIEPHSDEPPPPVIGVPCPGFEQMVIIPAIGQRQPFCVDQFESSLTDDGVPGDAMGNGTTSAAVSKRFAQPVTGVTFHQANAMCQNAGKRLCTAEEWITACRGDNDVTYPYGDKYAGGTCNGYLAGRNAPVESGAMFTGLTDAESGDTFAGGCVTQHGVYDMSGNVWEWNATSYLEGSRRGLAGGSFRSNSVGLRCVTDDNHTLPEEVNDAYGFRCCADFPL